MLVPFDASCFKVGPRAELYSVADVCLDSNAFPVPSPSLPADSQRGRSEEATKRGIDVLG